MNRRTTLTLTLLSALAGLGLALLPGSIVAQQGTLRQQLVGTWTIVSWEMLANGTKQQVANPKGILMFDAGGRYAIVIARAGRPKFKTGSQPTTEELAAIWEDFGPASNGTWSISEADKILTWRFETALVPNNEGTDAKWSVSLVGDELKLTSVAPVASGHTSDAVFRRAR
jgi:hypothetical protein